MLLVTCTLRQKREIGYKIRDGFKQGRTGKDKNLKFLGDNKETFFKKGKWN